MKLEDIREDAYLRGIMPHVMVKVVSVKWMGSEALERTYREPPRSALSRDSLPRRWSALRANRGGAALALWWGWSALSAGFWSLSHPAGVPLWPLSGGAPAESACGCPPPLSPASIAPLAVISTAPAISWLS